MIWSNWLIESFKPAALGCREVRAAHSKGDVMKALDVFAAVIVIVGALNWGLVGTMKFDLVATLFGATILTSIVYSLVGLCGIYQVVQWRKIQQRWHPAIA
jgi:uncharacterized protein